MEFDRCIATPDMMPSSAVSVKVLGPRGLMPNRASAPVTMDVAAAVKASKGGRSKFRVEKAGIVPARSARLVRRANCREHQGVRGRVVKGKPSAKGHLHPARRDLLDHGAGREGRSVLGDVRAVGADDSENGVRPWGRGRNRLKTPGPTA